MRKILAALTFLLLSNTAFAGDLAEVKAEVKAEVMAASEAFDAAYTDNDAPAYFAFYADNAVVFFYGERQDMAAYEQEWTATIEAGGGVEVNDMSDVVIQVMPSGDVAIVSSFIDNRSSDGAGNTTTVRAYETDIWQKIDGKWKVVGLHYSEIPSE